MTAGARRLALHLQPWLLLAVCLLVPPPGPDGKSLLALPPLCILRWVTGIPCPGCGILRSVVCLGHWDWHRSVQFHPLGPVAFAGILGWGILNLARLRWPDWKPTPVLQRSFHRTCIALLTVTVALWPMRLLGWLPAAP